VQPYATAAPTTDSTAEPQRAGRVRGAHLHGAA